MLLCGNWATWKVKKNFLKKSSVYSLSREYHYTFVALGWKTRECSWSWVFTVILCTWNILCFVPSVLFQGNIAKLKCFNIIHLSQTVLFCTLDKKQFSILCILLWFLNLIECKPCKTYPYREGGLSFFMCHIPIISDVLY